MNNFSKTKTFFILLFIFIFSFSLRILGLNWDQGQHLHPDERFLTMVTNDIKLPNSLFQYFDTAASPLNPFNHPSYQFFVYGTFPIFLTKIAAVAFNLDSYGTIHLLGRGLSALFDSFNVLLLYFLARKIIKKPFLRFIPSLLYGLTVLPLQLSHFYATDTFLNTFLLATFVSLTYGFFPLAGVFFGMALASKMSAVYLSPIILLLFFYHYRRSSHFLKTIFHAFIFALVSFLAFRILQPYSFTGLLTPNPKFVSSLLSLKEMSSPNSFFPPSIQWFNRLPLFHSLENIALFGLGLPLFIFFVFSLFKIRRKFNLQIIILFWIFVLFIFQGSQFTHNVRYFLPIYPFIVLISVSLCQNLNPRFFKILILIQSFFTLAFLNIYFHPNSRVQAAYWIYEHLPAGSVITNENWDDPLPFYLPHLDPNIYHGLMLSLYDPDSSETKWPVIQNQLGQAQYLIMSSNRLWGSIPRLTDLYPVTSKFYRRLFDGTSDFQKLIEINSYPGFSLSFLKACYFLGPTNYPGGSNSWFSKDDSCNYPGIYFRDDIAEESFTVYDHPKVLIFQKHQQF